MINASLQIRFFFFFLLEIEFFLEANAKSAILDITSRLQIINANLAQLDVNHADHILLAGNANQVIICQVDHAI